MNALISKQKDNPTSPFHPLIDSDYLLAFYEGDLADILWAMETFYEVTLKDFFELLTFAESDDWQKVKTLAHKLKPNFKLVGLTNWYDDLCHLELADYSKREICQHNLRVITFLEQKMKLVYMPILETEMNRLDMLVNQQKRA